MVELRTADGPGVVLQGHVLRGPTFRLAALISVSGTDTTWHRLVLNGYAVDVPNPSPPPVSVRAQARFDLMQQVDEARRAHFDSSGQSPSREDIARFTAEAYRRSPLVQRTEVVKEDSDWVVKVWWSAQDVEHIRFSGAPKSITPSRAALLRNRANQIANLVGARRLVFLANGVTFAPQPNETEQYLDAVAALQAGEPTTVFLPRRLAATISKPPATLETLREVAKHP